MVSVDKLLTTATTSETGWNLGSLAFEKSTDKCLLKQQNTEKHKGSKNSQGPPVVKNPPNSDSRWIDPWV